MYLNADMKYHMSSTGFHLIRVIFCDFFLFFVVAAFWFGCVCFIFYGFLLLLVEFVVFEREGGVSIKITVKD